MNATHQSHEGFVTSDEYTLVTSTGLTTERDVIVGWLYLLENGLPDEQQVASTFLKSQALDSWDVVEYIGEQGGVSLCLKVLSAPATAADVKDFAAWLLSQLVSGTWSSSPRHRKSETRDWGLISGDQAIFEAEEGVPILSKVVQSSSGYLQSHAAWVLARMAKSPEMSESITSTSIPQTLLKLCEAANNQIDVRVRAAWAIAELAESSISSRKIFIDLGAVKSFLASLENVNRAYDAYTAVALQALASLALQRSAAADGSFSLLDQWQVSLLLESFLPEVRAQAARIVVNIAMGNGYFKAQMLDSSSCMSRLRSLVHDPSPTVRNQAARTLFTLAPAKL